MLSLAYTFSPPSSSFCFAAQKQHTRLQSHTLMHAQMMVFSMCYLLSISHARYCQAAMDIHLQVTVSDLFVESVENNCKETLSNVSAGMQSTEAQRTG